MTTLLFYFPKSNNVRLRWNLQPIYPQTVWKMEMCHTEFIVKLPLINNFFLIHKPKLRCSFYKSQFFIFVDIFILSETYLLFGLG